MTDDDNRAEEIRKYYLNGVSKWALDIDFLLDLLAQRDKELQDMTEACESGKCGYIQDAVAESQRELELFQGFLREEKEQNDKALKDIQEARGMAEILREALQGAIHDLKKPLDMMVEKLSNEYEVDQYVVGAILSIGTYRVRQAMKDAASLRAGV